jgi:hypothetical protein
MIPNKFRSYSGKSIPQKFRFRLAKKNRDRPCAKKFSIAIIFALEKFQSTFAIMFRTLTPESPKFCSMYMHFVG